VNTAGSAGRASLNIQDKQTDGDSTPHGRSSRRSVVAGLFNELVARNRFDDFLDKLATPLENGIGNTARVQTDGARRIVVTRIT
jgi:hypothetical protein